MIARVDGRSCWSAARFPASACGRVSSGSARASPMPPTIAVDEPSADRRAPFADPPCGGCLYAHIAYQRQLEIKSRGHRRRVRAHRPRRRCRRRLTVAASPEDGYRMRARLHLRGRRIGFFREATHDVCDARATRQLLPDSCDALERLEAALRRWPGCGQEIELSENVDASERVVHLDAAAAIEVDAGALAAPMGLTGRGTAFGASAVPTSPTRCRSAERPSRCGVTCSRSSRATVTCCAISWPTSSTASRSAATVARSVCGRWTVCRRRARRCAARAVIAVEGDRLAAEDLHANAATAGGQTDDGPSIGREVRCLVPES